MDKTEGIYMKRKSLIALLAAIMVLAGSTFCFATSGLHIVSSYPEDKQTNTSMENLGVKITFNNDVNDSKLQKLNAKSVKMTDENGKTVPIDVLYSGKDGKMMLVVAKTGLAGKKGTGYQVLNNAEYKLTISKDFKDNKGNLLGKDEVITFKTYNQKMNNFVNMGMMVVMFGGLFLVSARSNSKREEEKEDTQPEEVFNPYKEAKRTGKTVDEVKAEHAKELEKKAKRKAKNHKEEAAYEKHFENCAELLNNVYHVHAPAPTSKEDRSVEALNKMRRAKKQAAKAAADAQKAKNAAKRKKK